jgi:ATP-dependent Clp protease ATP-binding subunit ClpC
MRSVLSTSRKKDSIMDRYTIDLNDRAQKMKLDPVIGRDRDITKITSVLLKRKKKNVLLVGEPGIGKTAIIEELANQIAKEESHPDLFGKTVRMLDTVGILGGTAERGEYETRVTELISELVEDNNTILMIDEIHTLVASHDSVSKSNSGNTKNSIVDMLKPALARGDICCIGATTSDEYMKYFAKDAAFERRFQVIRLEEPTLDEMLSILQTVKPIYEEYHGVDITDDAIEACVDLASRFLYYRNFPDKGIDLMDEACSCGVMKYSKTGELSDKVVTKHNIQDVIKKMLSIPTDHSFESDLEIIKKTESNLKKQIVGQDEAIQTIVNTLKRFQCGFYNKKRPIASLMFAGPTGTGKTEVAKLLGLHYFGSENSVIRIDMSEFQEPFSVASLIGPPPGYVGFEEGGILTNKIKQNPYTVVLFDEIEKAHYKVFDILLQILEEGSLTDSMGRRYSFSNSIVIMTSNIGFTHSKHTSLGFKTDDITCLYDRSIFLEQLKHTFRPEFLNRIDNIIPFNYLTESNIREIANNLMKSHKRNILKEKGVYIEITNKTKEKIYTEGFSETYGARPLNRAIVKYIIDPVSEVILKGKSSIIKV